MERGKLNKLGTKKTCSMSSETRLPPARIHIFNFHGPKYRPEMSAVWRLNRSYASKQEITDCTELNSTGPWQSLTFWYFTGGQAGWMVSTCRAVSLIIA